ncbi:unnamed protein product, partial [Ectocarpus fasciculatus]
PLSAKLNHPRFLCLLDRTHQHIKRRISAKETTKSAHAFSALSTPRTAATPASTKQKKGHQRRPTPLRSLFSVRHRPQIKIKKEKKEIYARDLTSKHQRTNSHNKLLALILAQPRARQVNVWYGGSKAERARRLESTNFNSHHHHHHRDPQHLSDTVQPKKHVGYIH